MAASGIDPFRLRTVRSVSDGPSGSAEGLAAEAAVPPTWVDGGVAHSTYFHTHLSAAEALRKAAEVLGAGATVNEATFKVKGTVGRGDDAVTLAVRLFVDKAGLETDVRVHRARTRCVLLFYFSFVVCFWLVTPPPVAPVCSGACVDPG